MKRLKSTLNKEKVTSLLKQGILNGRKIPDKTEELSLPFYLFKVFVDPGDGNSKFEYVLIDVVGGVFSFLDAKSLTDLEDFSQDYRQGINIETAEAIARKEYLFHLLHRNLRTKLKAKISNIEFVDTVFYPFWIGYFVHSNHYSMEVLDGLNGKKQFGALKKVVVNHLADEFESAKNAIHKPQDTVRSSGTLGTDAR